MLGCSSDVVCCVCDSLGSSGWTAGLFISSCELIYVIAMFE